MVALPSIAAGIMAAVLIPVPWWHPYCDRQDDGPGMFATGFPLPFSEFSQASSMTFVVNPAALVADVAMLAAVAYPMLASLRRRCGSRRAGRIAWRIGVCLIVVMATLLGWATYSSAIAFGSALDGTDPYRSYRPYVLLDRSAHRACEPY